MNYINAIYNTYNEKYDDNNNIKLGKVTLFAIHFSHFFSEVLFLNTIFPKSSFSPIVIFLEIIFPYFSIQNRNDLLLNLKCI